MPSRQGGEHGEGEGRCRPGPHGPWPAAARNSLARACSEGCCMVSRAGCAKQRAKENKGAAVPCGRWLRCPRCSQALCCGLCGRCGRCGRSVRQLRPLREGFWPAVRHFQGPLSDTCGAGKQGKALFSAWKTPFSLGKRPKFSKIASVACVAFDLRWRPFWNDAEVVLLLLSS